MNGLDVLVRISMREIVSENAERRAFIITFMKFLPLLAISFFLISCQPRSQRVITILNGESTQTIVSGKSTPSEILADAGITVSPKDRALINGIPYLLEDKIKVTGNIQLQLRRAVNVTLETPQGKQTLQTSALTVGDVLNENGIAIGIHDNVNPPLTRPVTDSLTITFVPAKALTVDNGGASLVIRSTAQTVGVVLSEAGIPLMGLDTSLPAENEPLPADGQIQVIRVSESILVELQSIPFPIEKRESADVAFGQQEILQNGANGVEMVRTRIRYENGVEVSRATEDKTIVSEPVTQIVASGTKIVLSEVGGDAPYQYWYATEMYASWYSPCNSGTGACSYGTASGARAGFGVVAVDYSFYSYLGGMRVYIPGYGIATIGDTGGGPIIETTFGVPRFKWIDLGYDDNNIGGLSGWVTVYFLEPAPAEIPYFFK